VREHGAAALAKVGYCSRKQIALMGGELEQRHVRAA
jgi:hypothetical protein